MIQFFEKDIAVPDVFVCIHFKNGWQANIHNNNTTITVRAWDAAFVGKIQKYLSVTCLTTEDVVDLLVEIKNKPDERVIQKRNLEREQKINELTKRFKDLVEIDAFHPLLLRMVEQMNALKILMEKNKNDS